jgi:drug/metabolite transporter (DMT)-like permease
MKAPVSPDASLLMVLLTIPRLLNDLRGLNNLHGPETGLSAMLSAFSAGPFAMPPFVAFIVVIMIWATTPLAIKWSSMGAGFLFAVAARMAIGACICLLILMASRSRIRHDSPARRVYLVAGLGIWSSMSCTYWGSQHIPSGLLSVIFGLTPVVTGVWATWLLREQVFTPFRILGMVLGVVGLSLIFREGLGYRQDYLLGIAAIVAALALQSFSAVWIKRINAGVNGFETTTGGLLVALPLFLLSWWLVDGSLPLDMEPRAAWSILYLGIFGSVIGFMLYFTLIHAWPANRVALITLVTPVIALMIGHLFNAESIGLYEWVGAAVILAALVSYVYGDQLVRRAMMQER